MLKSKQSIPHWREFEKLVARIEKLAGPQGLIVKSPDRIRCLVTKKLREVDASIRGKVGTSDVLVTIECRKRNPKQDVTWIEQLATKKMNIGADHTIAVSSGGFSENAMNLASARGIDVRKLSEISIEEIQRLMKIDFVIFPHKACAGIAVRARLYKKGNGRKLPTDADSYIDVSDDVVESPTLFTNEVSGWKFSVNDLWRHMQSQFDVFAGIPRDGQKYVGTVCFPFHDEVTIQTPKGKRRISDVLLTLALWFENEFVDLSQALKVEYSASDGGAVVHIEFSSQKIGMKDWRVAVQMPKNAKDFSELRSELNLPK